VSGHMPLSGARFILPAEEFDPAAPGDTIPHSQEAHDPRRRREGRRWAIQEGAELGLKPQAWKVEKASPEDSRAARQLLSDSELPTEGLEDTELWCVREGSRVIGAAGLEIWGRQGLLRSVAVDRRYRESGVGNALVKHVSKEASAKGLSELYLITETAPRFFERFGFEPFERKKVEGMVLNSVEFRGACSVTAPVMRLTLQ
jgi:amino-acid N-acetyltransferase